MAGLHGWVKGALGVSRGQCVEVDEFSRADKKQIVQAVWAARRVTEERIEKGWALVAVGRDPRITGWYAAEVDCPLDRKVTGRDGGDTS